MDSKWIPCSERLPGKKDWYLAVFQETNTGFQLIPMVADYIGIFKNGTTYDGWMLIDGENIPQEYLCTLKCVAWMPLPEPYKEEKE